MEKVKQARQSHEEGCVGVGENFPDKQDRALGAKCAMESQFPTQRAATALVVLKYEKLSGFISSLFTLSPLH